jgi:hypothetical protein
MGRGSKTDPQKMDTKEYSTVPNEQSRNSLDYSVDSCIIHSQSTTSTADCLARPRSSRPGGLHYLQAAPSLPGCGVASLAPARLALAGCTTCRLPRAFPGSGVASLAPARLALTGCTPCRLPRAFPGSDARAPASFDNSPRFLVPSMSRARGRSKSVQVTRYSFVQMTSALVSPMGRY